MVYRLSRHLLHVLLHCIHKPSLWSCHISNMSTTPPLSMSKPFLLWLSEFVFQNKAQTVPYFEMFTRGSNKQTQQALASGWIN